MGRKLRLVGNAGLLVELQCQFGVGDDEGGYVQSAFILSFLVAAPLVGFAGDRWSRKVGAPSTNNRTNTHGWRMVGRRR